MPKLNRHVQKQPSRGALKKRCSENMQKICSKGEHPCQGGISQFAKLTVTACDLLHVAISRTGISTTIYKKQYLRVEVLLL